IFYYPKQWLKPCNFIVGTLVSVNFIDLQDGISTKKIPFRESLNSPYRMGDEVSLSWVEGRCSSTMSRLGGSNM
ncbi:MAG: hypothetical protein RBR30_11020, partial [Tenuifilaceae bacterium]|nr:hypothetical protein [Tenuifilaceae bacterium]